MNLVQAKEDNRELLLKAGIFHDLDEKTLSFLSSKLTLNKFYPESAIYEKGSPSTGLYILTQGIVDLYSISPNGKRVVFSSLKPISTFGEIGFLDGKPRETEAIAQTVVETLVLKRADYIDLMDTIGPLSWFNIMYMLCQSNRTLLHNIETLTLSGPKGRIIRKLLELSSKRVRGRDSFNIQISHEKLGSMLDLTRESVSKILADLEERDLITKSRGSILVKTVAGLQLYLGEVGDD